MAVSAADMKAKLALIIAGALTIPAAGAFSKIVQTQGNDISHLMDALRRFFKAVFAQLVSYIVLGVLFVLAMLLIILALVFLASVLGGAASP